MCTNQIIGTVLTAHVCVSVLVCRAASPTGGGQAAGRAREGAHRCGSTVYTYAAARLCLGLHAGGCVFLSAYSNTMWYVWVCVLRVCSAMAVRQEKDKIAREKKEEEL